MGDEVRTVDCPQCRHPLTFRDLRGGRFRIECPGCRARLIVRVVLEPTTAIAVEVEPGPLPTAEPGPPPKFRPTPLAPLPPGSSHWAGPYRLVGAWEVVRGGLGRVGRWLGFGPAVGLAAPRPVTATDAPFLAAWALEVVAARALRHPNLEPPGDVFESGRQFWAAEPLRADASPLSDPAGARASLDRSARVAAILHAARALRHAHEQGVYHRVISLDALVADTEGLVSVRGLGVGLTPEGLASRPAPSPPPAPAALPVPGLAPTLAPAPTPPTPSPPPDSAALGDVTELGRALATLVGGLEGDRAVPPGLARLVRRLGTDESIDPRERVRDMGEVVRALEAELNVSLPWHPPEADAEAFRAALDEPEAPLARLRRLGTTGLLALAGLVGLLLLARGAFGPLLALATLVGGSALTLGVLRALDDRARYAGLVAEVLGVLNRRDGITLVVLALLTLGTLYASGLVIPAVALLALAGSLGAGIHLGLDRPIASEEADRRDWLRTLVRGWRRLGADEAAIRRFVLGVATSGVHRRQVAALFPIGSEPSLLGLAARSGLAWLAGAVAARRSATARDLLGPILERAFEARGVQTLTARRRSKRAAEAVVAVAEQYRRAPDATVGLPLLDALHRATERPEDFLHSPEIAEAAEPSPLVATASWLTTTLLGPHVRFVLGAACLAMSLSWLEQNDFWAFDRVTEAARTVAVDGNGTKALEQIRATGDQARRGFTSTLAGERKLEPLPLPGLPAWVDRLLNDGFALAASGLILVLSATVGGLRIIPIALVAAVVPFAPRLVLGGTRPLDGPSLAALGLGLGGFLLAWRAERHRVG